ncbi:MAG: 50S ribosomal protein L28 [Deltaproteobacteria bacterium]|nr:50S ribosomal protein L28 [Deltaproteobacteria bacterium]
MAHNRSKCDLCGKSPLVGFNVSHAHNKTKKRQKPNIHSHRVRFPSGTTKRVFLCTSCLRKGTLQKIG